MQVTVQVATRGRGLYDITDAVRDAVHRATPRAGLAHLFIQHTSASLLISENADRQVGGDLEAFFARLVPDGDALFRHVAEGPDDMPAHVRSALTDCSVTVPINDGELALGTWQGIFVWEHRHAGHQRSIVITVQDA